MAERKPIFYDEEKRRWRRTRRALELAGGLFTLILVIFLVNVSRKPDLPEILRPDVGEGLHAVRTVSRTRATARPRLRRVAALGKIPEGYTPPIRAAFYVSDDPTSFASLQLHYRDIDLLIPDLLHAVMPDGTLKTDYQQKLADFLQDLQKRKIELPVMAMVNNYDNVAGWCPPGFIKMLANPAARAQLARQLEQYAQDQHDPGIVVDFESLPETSQKDFQAFVHRLGSDLHSKGLKLMVALPAADWSYDYKYFASQTDELILMNYDFHWSSSPPGPIAPQGWFQTNITNILKVIPASKIVMGIANYGYDWTAATKQEPKPIAQPVSFQQAVVTAVESGADITYDPNTFNLHYSYDDASNRLHAVWMLDGVTAYNELRASERAGVAGTAVWRLGMEDPSMWTIWDAVHADNTTRAKLSDVPPGYDLIMEGKGDIWKITAMPESGRRTFDYDSESDVIDDESFESYPLSWRVQQMGNVPKKVALSFDDGPDPEWTPKVLDVLQQKHAPATFFVIGESAAQQASIIKREYATGDEIGNHTFTHPDFETASTAQIQLELNLTELFLDSRLGVKTTLFRPPYGIDHEPESATEFRNLPTAQDLGYVIVGAEIDPHDWGELTNGGAPPPVQTIVQRVVAGVKANEGNVILMHDGGGDRSHTLAALPQIIDQVRAAGYQFVSVSELLGQTRAQVMPPLSAHEWLLARADALIFDVFSWFRSSIAFIFVAGIFLVSARALIVGLLALAEKFRSAAPEHPDYQPSATVLIPAYNEESVIVHTVRAALASGYPRLEVLVVDDGSTDRTAALVRQNFGADPRVRLLTQENHGKPAALNHGLAVASGEIIVSIDADTIVDKEAIPRLVWHFADPNVGAVAGNIKVINRNSWITRWQALEYITSQNLEKRAFDLLNCIPVVPGAAGAWRAELLRENGGFSGDTVAEDTDLTLTIRRNGWKILYDEDAIGRTEVPDTVEALIRQRFRWTFGTLQAVWKHRDTTAKPRYGTLGWVAIPNIFLFQILLPMVSPIIDVLFLLSILLWGLAQLRIAALPQLWTSQDVERSLIFFALFMLIDLFTCVVAFALEKQEDWTLLAPLIIQRFYYRQMMYVVLFRSLKEAVRGRPVGWRGVVEPPVPERAVHA